MHKRTTRLQATVRPHERQVVEQAAEKLGRTVAEFVREVTLEEATRVLEYDGPQPVGPSWRHQIRERTEG